MPQELDRFWPSIEEINRCIKAEAESAHESLILAVHQTTPLSKRSTGEGARTTTPVTEQDLLNAFLTQDLPTGTLVLPITGVSGVGKSHMIRWLFAQLKRTEEYEAGKLHIIRIPKSASLRTVIRLILDPLKGDQYDQLRDALQKAAAEVTPEVAGIQLRYGLEMGLKQLQNQIKKQISDASTAVEVRRKLKLTYAHAERLPSLFRDNAVMDQYEKILEGIIMRAIEGKQEGEQDQIPRFEPDDLLLCNPSSILKAYHDVLIYYQRIEGSSLERQNAVEVLNDVLDSAIGFAFNLGQSLGGKTLQDIFLDIREQLLNEQKELVLLIEDFAALAGIQDPLLKICIQEAIRDGEQVLCRMRTAVAVTDGDWSGRDTVLTRVQKEWRVQSKLSSEEDIIDKTVELVGSYLNAARIGDSELRRLFVAIQNSRDADLFSWVPTYGSELQDETLETLKAFGISRKGYWLFPFNKIAIVELAKKQLKEGGELVFNPRSIINGILRNVLLKRDLYETDNFPEVNFEGESASMFSTEQVARSGLSDVAKGRYKSLLRFWGGNPEDEKQLQLISLLVPRAFGLEPLPGMGDTATEQVSDPGPATGPDPGPTSVPEPEAAPRPEPGTNPEPGLPPEVMRWKNILEDWTNSVPISQADANKLRNCIGDTLKSYINWNALLIAYPSGKLSKDIFFNIYLAKGSNSSSLFEVVVAESNKDEDARMRRAFLALICYVEIGSWDYPGGEDDCLHYAELMERLSPPVVARYRELADMRLAPLGSLLAWSNHILGTAPPVAGDDPEELVNSIWQSLGPPPVKTVHEEWDNCRHKCHSSQKALTEAINLYCAAFQGEGTTPLAIDAVRIVDLLPYDVLYNDISVQTVNSLFSPGDPINTAMKEVALLTRKMSMKGRLNLTIQLIQCSKETFSNLLAPDEDMAMVVKELNKLITEAQADGMSWPTTVAMGADQLQALVTGLASTDLGVMRNKLSEIVERFAEGDCPHVAYAIALLDQSSFLQSVSAVRQITLFLLEIEKKLDEMTNLAAQNDPKPVAEKIGFLLGEIDEQLKQLQEA
jgi:hypothetical protein